MSIIIEMTRDATLKRWAARHDIQERMPGYKVRLGCGLHYGWAIECAIGSQHKIDASYLSPHVNLSSRLEAATKQYGVMILLSGEMHSLMSDEVATRAQTPCPTSSHCNRASLVMWTPRGGTVAV